MGCEEELGRGRTAGEEVLALHCTEGELGPDTSLGHPVLGAAVDAIRQSLLAHAERRVRD